MNSRITKKKLILNIVLLVTITIISLNFVLKGEDKREIISILGSTKKIYLYLGIILSLIFILGEAINIKSMLKIIDYDISLIKGIKYAFIGFFFSGITPSSTGGQPMQIYEMKKDGIQVSHSSLVLLLALVSYQIVSFLYGFVGLIWFKDTMVLSNKTVLSLIFAGLSLNIVGIIFILTCIFNSKISIRVYKFIEKVMVLIPFINSEKKERVLKNFEKQIEEYNRCASYIKENKSSLFKVFLITIIQMGSLFSISYVVYLALGQHSKSILDIVLLQGLIYTGSSFIPIPGAVGVSETNFLSIFRGIYRKDLISGAMLLSRGISFYLLIIISVFSIILIKIREIQVIRKLKSMKKNLLLCTSILKKSKNTKGTFVGATGYKNIEKRSSMGYIMLLLLYALTHRLNGIGS